MITPNLGNPTGPLEGQRPAWIVHGLDAAVLGACRSTVFFFRSDTRRKLIQRVDFMTKQVGCNSKDREIERIGMDSQNYQLPVDGLVPKYTSLAGSLVCQNLTHGMSTRALVEFIGKGGRKRVL